MKVALILANSADPDESRFLKKNANETYSQTESEIYLSISIPFRFGIIALINYMTMH